MTLKKPKNEPPRFFGLISGIADGECDEGTVDDLASGGLTISSVAFFGLGEEARSDEPDDVGAVDTVAIEKLADIGLTGLIESEQAKFVASEDFVRYRNLGIEGTDKFSILVLGTGEAMTGFWPTNPSLLDFRAEKTGWPFEFLESTRGNHCGNLIDINDGESCHFLLSHSGGNVCEASSDVVILQNR